MKVTHSYDQKRSARMSLCVRVALFCCLSNKPFVHSFPTLSSHNRVNRPPTRCYSYQNDSNQSTTASSFSSLTDASTLLSSNPTTDNRIIFPEYNTGQVPRLYSRLDAQRTARDPGNVFGAAALVAGTTIGAGILALPVTTATAGFIPSTIGLVGAYAVMTISGLLLAELTLNRLANTGKPEGTGILSLLDASLGKPWSSVGTVAYFFLHYAIMVAYVSQGGDNITAALGTVGGGGQFLFCGTIAMAIGLLGERLLERINNLLVVGVFASFAGILGVGAQTADFGMLVEPARQHPEEILNCMPVILLAFVYQNVVPVIVKDLEGDRSKIKQAIITGTAMPLLMFLAWNAVILGNTGANSGVDDIVRDPLATLQGSNGILAPLVSSFSSLALVTSMIGFVYGLIDAWTDLLQLRNPALLYSLVFLPPLGLSLANPDSFLTALDYGGAFGVSTLFVLLPPICAWNERYESDAPLLTEPLTPYGRLPLVILGACATGLVLQQVIDKVL